MADRLQVPNSNSRFGPSTLSRKQNVSIKANSGEGYDSVGSNLADQTFQQDGYSHESVQKMEPFNFH